MDIGEPIRRIEVVPQEQPQREEKALPSPKRESKPEREKEKVPV